MLRRFYILIVLICFIGCDSDEWKETAPTSFDVVVNKSVSSVSYFQLLKGDLYLDRFRFEGKRVESVDVDFDDEFDSNNRISVESSTLSAELKYDIPQGTYEEIKVDLRLKSKDSKISSILLEGLFTGGGASETVVFIYDDRIDYEVKVKTANGGSEVAFVAENAKTGTIVFDAIGWMSVISETSFQNADRYEYNGDSDVILITEKENEDLYNIVVARIGLSDVITF